MTHVDIEYCVPCGFRDVAVDAQNAILDAYGREVDGVQLTPGHGGVFVVRVDGDVVWDSDERGGGDPEAIREEVGTFV